MRIFHAESGPLSRSLAALSLFAGTAFAAGGNLDLTVSKVEITQGVQDGHTLPSAGKSTMVRALVQATGTVPGGTLVDGVMHVFIDGSEAPYSPVYSVNGPIVPQNSPSELNLDDTLNFVFLPGEGSISVSVEVNPAGPVQVEELDFANNTKSSPALPFVCRRTPELVYVPIDYRLGGGPTPNLPDPTLIEPGIGDNFVQGIYPSGDWIYFAAPPKLWTDSLSGTGSALNAALAVDLQQMNPQPDFIYGWINGGLPYNGQAIGIPGNAAMGNTQPIRHQRTFAHELGHLFGEQHNNADINVIGVDVEHQLNLTEGLSQIKDGNHKDIMAAGLLTEDAWVWPSNYKDFGDDPQFQCGAGAFEAPTRSLLVSGLWNLATGDFELRDSFVFEGRPTASADPEQANLALRLFAGDELVGESLVSVTVPTDCADGGEGADTNYAYTVDPIGSFVSVLAVDTTLVDRFAVVEIATGEVLATLERSTAAPVLQVSTPSTAELNAGALELSWQASDADGDALSYYVRYSPDGQRIQPLASNITANALAIDLAPLAAIENGGYFEVLATDGMTTTSARTSTFVASADGAGSSVPILHIATPDDGKSFPKGGTVILHSSGWDEEDRALDGASIVWTSDLDGMVATGRLTSSAALSVGTHVLTATATDSNGNSVSDTTTITVAPRDLPDGSDLVCQTDLGFGGPGSSTLEMCGGDLSTGTSADLSLTGAAPNAAGWLIYSLTNNPVPAIGGTIVPVPPSLLTLTTDGSGAWGMEDVAGGGAFTLYLQAAYADAAQPFGFGLSNALQVDFLP